MAIVEQKTGRRPLSVPFAMDVPDRAPQGALLRPRLLRAGGRAAVAPGLADGLPARGDPARRTTSPSTRSSTSRSSSCAPRTAASGRSRTPAATAASRSPRGGARCESGFTCPFHGWCYGPDGTNTFVPSAEDVLRAQPAAPATSTSRPCGARSGAGARGSTSTTTRRRCGSASSRSPSILDAWKVESLRTEWWYAFRLPVNWKLAEEAFLEQYHVLETPPAARHPRRGTAARSGGRSTPAPSSTPSSTTCAR